MNRLDAAAIASARNSTSEHHHPEHAKARREAFDWYHGEPPSPQTARRHFAEKRSRDPVNTLIYLEALEIFLATCHPARR